MNIKDAIEKVREMTERDIQIMISKGHDYSGEQDTLANLKDFGIEGIIVRIGDKYHRLRRFVQSGLLKVKDESVKDTLMDICNYTRLGELLLEEDNSIHPVIKKEIIEILTSIRLDAYLMEIAFNNKENKQ